MGNWQFVRLIRASAAAVGIILIGLFFWVRQPFLLVGFALCYGVVLPGLALSRRLFLGRQDTDLSSVPRIRSRGTVVLAVVLLLGLSYVAVGLAPYVYTPPALTRKNLEFYQKCVDFTLSHPEYQEFDLLRSGRLFTGEGTWLVHREFDRGGLSKWFSEHDIDELRQLTGLMKQFRCIQVARRKDIVLFYQNRSMFLPTRPGVAYALDGENPNRIASKEVQELLPFIRVRNDWYCSRWLVLDGLRRCGPVRVPHSLIDHADRFEE
jgi:hypothetical protein